MTKKRIKEALIIWDDAQLFHIISRKGFPTDRPVILARRMWDITHTMNKVLESVPPNVIAVTCVLNPHSQRIVDIKKEEILSKNEKEKRHERAYTRTLAKLLRTRDNRLT